MSRQALIVGPSSRRNLLFTPVGCCRGMVHRLLMTVATSCALVALSGGAALADESVALTFGAAPSSASGAPARGAFDISASPGSVVRDTIVVSNYSDTPLVVRVYASDATTDASGGFGLLPFGSSATGVGSWVELPRTDGKVLRMAPRTEVSVPFDLRVPEDAEPGDHLGGISVSLPSSSADVEDATAVLIEPRIGVPIRVRVAGELSPALEVTSLSAAYTQNWAPWNGGTLEVLMTVRNTGNLTLAGETSVELGGPFGSSRSLPISDLAPLPPGSETTVSALVEDVAPVIRYDVTGSVVPLSRAGDPAAQMVAASARVWAVPVPQLLVLLLLVAIAVAVMVVARFRSRRPQADAPPSELVESTP